MATYTGTDANNSWTVINPGTFSLDGLGGTDTLYLGTSLRSSYSITRSTDGAVHVDSVSGASGVLHATLVNMERLVFNSGRDTLDLTTYFGDTTPPTVSITDDTAGTATGNVKYTLAFSESVTGLAANDFLVSNGSVLSVTGSGASYQVLVQPAADTQGTLGLTLKAGAVADAAGNLIKTDTVAAAQPFDTVPSLTGTGSNDAFNVSTISERIDGLAGIDTVNFGGARSAYTLTIENGVAVVSATSGSTTLTLSHIERLQFADHGVALDLDGHAGEVARLLGTVFGTEAAHNPQYVGIGLQLLDGGMSTTELAAAAVNVAGLQSHDALVTQVWTQLVGSAPSAADKAPYVAMLDNGSLGVGALVMMAADTALAASHIDLTGLAQTGLDFS